MTKVVSLLAWQHKVEGISPLISSSVTKVVILLIYQQQNSHILNVVVDFRLSYTTTLASATTAVILSTYQCQAGGITPFIRPSITKTVVLLIYQQQNNHTLNVVVDRLSYTTTPALSITGATFSEEEKGGMLRCNCT